ncbi:MAG: hypothetical protein ABIR55_03650, partial [Burkholderiaceae bacterium]
KGYMAAGTGAGATNLALDTLIGTNCIFNTGVPTATALATGTPGHRRCSVCVFATKARTC